MTARELICLFENEVLSENLFGLCFLPSLSGLSSYNLVMFHSYALAGAVISDDLERCDRVSKVRFYCIYIMSNHPSLNNHEDCMETI